MSFAHPWFLLALLGVVPAALAYSRLVRRERAATATFVPRALRAAVLPVRARWRRHVPVALFGLGLAALLAAPARPQARVEVPSEQASIMLVTDVSGSMQARDVAPTRLEAARKAAEEFVDAVPDRIKVGVVAFNHAPTVLQAPTADHAAVQDALARLRHSGGTATGDALDAALQSLSRTAASAPKAIVLLSDGYSTRGRDPVAVARVARRRKIPVYTISLGTASGTITVRNPDGSTRTETVPPDPEMMATVAQTAGGQAFRTADAGQLRTVYERLGSRLSTRVEQRELTAGFAGAALLLVLAGSALSLAWFGRPA